MLNSLIFFLILLVINLLYNGYNYNKSTIYLKKFEEWLLDHSKHDLRKEKPLVISLVKRANQYDMIIDYQEFIGFGNFANYKINPIEQFPNNDRNIVPAILRQLESTIGVYRERMKYSYHPMYWIDLVIYAPSKILNYVGFESDSLKKVLNIVWWLLGIIIIPALLNAYSDEISNFIKK